MTIKAVLFDMDGVLIDAKEWHYESLNRALDLFGLPISRFDHLTTYDGLPTLKKLEMLSVVKGLPQALHDFINEMKQAYTTELVHVHCKPEFAHEYALANLKSLGFRLAVCSNSVRQTVEIMMKKSNLISYLDLMISNEDVKMPKPDPEMYLKAMTDFNLSPDECLVVEDNENGIAAAKASGAHLLVVKNTRDTNIDNLMRAIDVANGHRK